MQRRYYWALFALLVGSVEAACQDGKVSELSGDLPTLTFEVRPESRLGQYHATIDAGEIDAGEEYRVRIIVRNPTDQTMVFQGIEESCACYGTKASGLVLNPDGEIRLEFVGPVKKKLKMPEAFWRVRLKPQDPSDMGGIAIKVNYRVGGLMSFLDQRVVLELSPNRNPFVARIPMLITAPVMPAGIVTVVPEDFGENATASVVEDEGKTFLRLSVSGNALRDQYVAGEISCYDEVTGREDSVYCVIRKSAGVSVFPAILRATHAEENDTPRVVTAIIRIDEFAGRTDAADDLRKPEDVVIDATVAGKPLKIEVTKMSATVYRIKFKLSEPTLQALANLETPLVEWIIRTSHRSYTIRSRVSV